MVDRKRLISKSPSLKTDLLSGIKLFAVKTQTFDHIVRSQ